MKNCMGYSLLNSCKQKAMQELYVTRASPFKREWVLNVFILVISQNDIASVQQRLKREDE